MDAQRDSQDGSIVGRLLGSYRIGKRVGAGGIGAVYEGEHVRTGRLYAVKVLLPDAALEPTALKRFRREAEALASLGHASIVAVHDFDVTEDGIAYLVMDRLQGEDLSTRLSRGPLGLAEALHLFDQIADALTGAHESGILHRDLKPSNVFLAERPGAPDRAVLLDFGLAKFLKESTEVSRLTASGATMGTPMYMSPEQAQGYDVDVRTDVYSLGAILFECLTARPPFEGPTLTAILSKVLTHPPPSVRHLQPHVPQALDDVLRRALAKVTLDRQSSVAMLRMEVESATRGVPMTEAAPMRGAVPPTQVTPVAVARAAASGVPGTAVTPIVAAVPRGQLGDTPLGVEAPVGAQTPIGARTGESAKWPWMVLTIVLGVVLVSAAAVGIYVTRPAGSTDPEPIAPVVVAQPPTHEPPTEVAESDTELAPSEVPPSETDSDSDSDSDSDPVDESDRETESTMRPTKRRPSTMREAPSDVVQRSEIAPAETREALSPIPSTTELLARASRERASEIRPVIERARTLIARYQRSIPEITAYRNGLVQPPSVPRTCARPPGMPLIQGEASTRSIAPRIERAHSSLCDALRFYRSPNARTSADIAGIPARFRRAREDLEARSTEVLSVADRRTLIEQINALEQRVTAPGLFPCDSAEHARLERTARNIGPRGAQPALQAARTIDHICNGLQFSQIDTKYTQYRDALQHSEALLHTLIRSQRDVIDQLTQTP